MDLFDLSKDEKKIKNTGTGIVKIRGGNKEISEEKVRKMVFESFNVDNMYLFPKKDFDDATRDEIEEELVKLLMGMSRKDPEKRLSLNQVIEELVEIVNIVGLDIEDLRTFGINQKDLYGLGIFTKENLSERENKIKKDLELLKEGGKSKDFKEQTHLNTLTGKKELSEECKECLKNLSNCFGKEGEIKLNLENNEEFKKNLEEIRKSGNQREYLLVVNEMLEIKELKMNREIFRLEEIKKGIEKDKDKEKSEKEIESKKEELRKFKEEKGLIMQKHAELSRMSNVIRERGENKEAKKELEKLLKITGEFSSLEKGTGTRER